LEGLGQSCLRAFVTMLVVHFVRQDEAYLGSKTQS